MSSTALFIALASSTSLSADGLFATFKNSVDESFVQASGPHSLEVHLIFTTNLQPLLPENPSSWDKVQALRTFLYTSGPWNGYRPFSYDHDDPYGDRLENKLLSTYLETRKGNCITMPALFLILAEELGLDVAPALAPLHMLVKFTDDEGRVWNLETTSGAGAAREEHYRELLPITDAAIENGVYLKALNEDETKAAFSALLVEQKIEQGDYRGAIDLADELLELYPKFVYIMVKKATAAYYLLEEEFYRPYPDPREVPEEKRADLVHFQKVNAEAFAEAESLGWKPVR